MLLYYIRNFICLTSASLALSIATNSARADVRVVASIKPIHSIAAVVMQGAGTPTLLLDGAASPHTYAFTPRDAQSVQDAEVVFWIGPELETFLVKPLTTLGENAASVPLLAAHGLETLPVRESNTEEHAAHADTEHHGGTDAHIWLDPRNAIKIAEAMAAELSKVDPAKANLYLANTTALKMQLASFEAEIGTTLSSAKKRPVIVMHDAFQYFETRFGLPASIALSIHPENPPGAATLKEIRRDLMQKTSACIFSEPQFDPKMVDLLTEGLDVKKGVIDPLGAALPEGPEMYFALLRSIAASWTSCTN
jgi:zinc transport system substrate-binding protein